MDVPNRKSNRLESYDYSEPGCYFITICTKDRQQILSRIVGTPVPGCPQIPHPELLAYGQIADKYIRQMDAFYDNISVDKYVIMPDHIHILLTVQNGQSRTPVPTRANSMIAKFVGTFKRFSNKEYGENIWQGRYYDHVVRNQADYNESWEYIDGNPQKWITKEQG